jgi:hypothetical protein
LQGPLKKERLTAPSVAVPRRNWFRNSAEKAALSQMKAYAKDYPCFAFASLFSRFARRDFFLAAVLLCIVPVDASLSSFFATSRYCSFAASALPPARSCSNRLIWVFILLFLARLTSLHLAFCLTLFFADNERTTLFS